MDGNQVSPDLVSKVGETFESILKEACLFISPLTLLIARNTHLAIIFLIVSQIYFLQTEFVRQEFSEDISIRRAIAIVFDRRPDLRLEGLGQKVLQWYLCRMEGWFAADSDTISLKGWDQVISSCYCCDFYFFFLVF